MGRAIAMGWVGAYLFWASCVPSSTPSDSDLSSDMAGSSAGAIVGGIPSSEGAVGLLEVVGEHRREVCSAVVIAPHTLLTAAHCVDERMFGGVRPRARVTFRSRVAEASSKDWRAIAESVSHPEFNPAADLSHDLALLWVEAGLSVTPLKWNGSVDIAGLGGAPLTLVGYGKTSPEDTASPQRRSTVAMFRQITATHIRIGNFSSQGICFGDSGGPSLHTFADGQVRVVGIHSSSQNLDCTDGTDIRVDAYREFLWEWLAEREGETTCLRDSRCDATCQPADPDCVCIADGLCSPECPRPEWDSDCPGACAKNGLCQANGCGSGDADCLPLGERCDASGQCATGRCHSESRTCVNECKEGECAQGYRCLAGACQPEQAAELAAQEPTSAGLATRGCGATGAGLEWLGAALAGFAALAKRGNRRGSSVRATRRDGGRSSDAV